MLKKIKGYKKITAVLLALVTASLQDVLGIDADAAGQIIEVLTYYLIGQGIADAGSDFNTKRIE